ncbi:hypothetical protein [Cronobacter sakazakii]|uniref:hypothetical protein n=1 Tax=Cronobacter sakazakii TaxID=28141 RepID=UPI000A18D8DC|nr:hypothetical protein [Cronobacter sakazakii]PQY52667.1 hypothetical protein C5945_03630 [Cronobacter sakazakii]PUZ01823.1 hypothetical protein B8W55_03630 [Cronobacter sakazakii]
MALVKVISSNLFAGANFQKLEIGSEVEVANSIAERWVNAGLAEYLEVRQLEVATPKRGRKPKDKE